jgi:hypothetical protein
MDNHLIPDTECVLLQRGRTRPKCGQVGPAEHSIELDTKQLTPQTTKHPNVLVPDDPFVSQNAMTRAN